MATGSPRSSRDEPGTGHREQGIPIQDYPDVAAQQRSFAQFGAYTSGTMNVSGTDRAERYSGSWVSQQLFTMTGVQPILGRDFRPGEDTPQGARVVVLGYDMWQTRFGGDPTVLGTSIRVNGVPVRGHRRDARRLRLPAERPALAPAADDPLVGVRGEGLYVTVVGKLAPGVTHEQAAPD